MKLSPRVTACIDRFFPDAERDDVAAMLAELSEGSTEAGAERLQLLILKISRRQARRIRSLVDAAKVDYRDVIAAATQPSRTYFIGLLRTGPNGRFDDKATLDIACLKRWKQAGAIVIGGMCLDRSDLRGLYIFTLDTIEEVQKLIETDPGIASGRLKLELHPWTTADGLQVGVPRDFLDVGI